MNNEEVKPDLTIVYIAGPYRHKNLWGRVKNILHARKYARKYWQMGYYVICPHMNTALADAWGSSDLFLKGYLHILSKCDILVTIPGWYKSCGSRDEVDYANRHGIKVIHDS